MKKLFETLLVMTAIITIAIAQSTYDFYKMQNKSEADAVLNALNTELKLSDSQSAELRELLYGSMKGQVEIFQKPENTDADVVQGVLRRQTGHIEGNLQEMIGEAKFKIYLQKKPAIEKQLHEKN